MPVFQFDWAARSQYKWSVIPFCSPVAELNQWLGTQKLSGVDRPAQTRQVHINSHAYTCIHHRIQLAVSDMTMSG